MNHFIYNGKILKEATPIIGPDNRGLRYGDGIFETMKLLDGELQMPDEHFARLWKGMATLGFDIPRHFTPEKLTAETQALAKKNGHQKAARIRLQLTRGDGGLYDVSSHSPNYIIQTWALPAGNDALNSNGLVLGIYEDARKSCDILSNLKHNNYLPYVMAALYAKKQKWNDALLLNTSGRICDSTIANIFLVKKGEFFTPALSEGCVAGVMRGHLVQHLKKAGFNIQETHIAKDDIQEAEEVFLTNSIYCIRWVHRIGDNLYHNDLTRKIYAGLLSTIV
jgi:branched-chain amino acid aminotransferase